MKRFVLGLSLGVLFAAGLSIRELFIESGGSLVDFALELVLVVMPALVVAIAFASRKTIAPFIALALVAGYWWHTGGQRHYFGYPADGFFANYVMAFVGIAMICAAVIGTLLTAKPSGR